VTVENFPDAVAVAASTASGEPSERNSVDTWDAACCRTASSPTGEGRSDPW
jgi:hypothetical protein